MFKTFIEIATKYAVEAGVTYREAAMEISILRPDFYFEGGADVPGTIGELLGPAKVYRQFCEAKRVEFENESKIRKAFGTLAVYIEQKLKSQMPQLAGQFGHKFSQ